MRKLAYKRFDFREVMLTLLPWAVICLQSLYTLHVVNQFDLLKIELQNQINKTHHIENSMYMLTKRVNTTLDTLQSTKTSDNLALITQNDMTQFYVKALGITAGIVIVLVICSNIYPTLFSVKTFLPSYAYSAIQQYTPFFQTKKEYIIPDIAQKIDLIVNVYNDKWAEVLVKSHLTEEIISATEYISNIGVINIQTVANPAIGLLPAYTPEATDLALAGFVASFNC